MFHLRVYVYIYIYIVYIWISYFDFSTFANSFNVLRLISDGLLQCLLFARLRLKFSFEKENGVGCIFLETNTCLSMTTDGLM